MLETVIATAVIGLLATIAIPKLSRALDVCYVDYEIRCLHSLMHYSKTVGRLASDQNFGLGDPIDYEDNSVELFIIYKSDYSDAYIMRKFNTIAPMPLTYYHTIERDFKFSLESTSSGSFRFNSEGEFSPAKNETIVLIKDDIKRGLVLTQYGRIRIARTW